ncbi:MAG: hypothetical protein GY786_11490, partial [Proteobacteria bacterium]|nr:hypothetical protein [Pseudomonadota bacterium]
SIKNLRLILLSIFAILCFTSGYGQSARQVGVKTEIRYVASSKLNVFSEASSSSNLVGTLHHLDKIIVETLGVELTEEVREQIRRDRGIWVKIISPLEGYIFQKRLIKSSKKMVMREKDEEISAESFLDKVLGRKSKNNKKAEDADSEVVSFKPEQMSSSNKKIWINFGLGLIVLPEEAGYSSSIMDTMDFSVDYDYEPIPILKIRGGLNMSKSTGGTYETSTNSFYGALRFPFSLNRPSFIPDFLKDPKFQGLAGLVYMMTTLTSGGSGSSSTIGFMGGATADAIISEGWRMGAQVVLISGSTSLGGKSKYVGSNQISMSVGKLF